MQDLGKNMLIAGPCALESREQAVKIARFVKSCGATHFRAGCWKGQNYPIVDGKPAYMGMGYEGVNILSDIQAIVSIPCVTEVQNSMQYDFVRDFPFIQVGARHMQDFPLLQSIRSNYNGQVILKRGFGNTIDEWIGAAEHLGGPEKVILCERGICSFDRTSTTRWRLDMVGVAYIKECTPYRIIVDPSHGSGDRRLIHLLTKCILPIADGLVVEVHYNPDKSPTDARQTINFKEFEKIADEYRRAKVSNEYERFD